MEENAGVELDLEHALMEPMPISPLLTLENFRERQSRKSKETFDYFDVEQTTLSRMFRFALSILCLFFMLSYLTLAILYIFSNFVEAIHITLQRKATYITVAIVSLCLATAIAWFFHHKLEKLQKHLSHVFKHGIVSDGQYTN